MPTFGIGLHVLVALFFAIHAVRQQRELYWLLILFMFPLLGSMVYFFAVYLPEMRLRQHAGKAVNLAVKVLDPGRALREAQAAYEDTPSAQHRMNLAQALLQAGQPAEAAAHYEACLAGPLSGDPELRLGALRARLAEGHAQAVLDHAQALQAQAPSHRAEEVLLAQARALQLAGRGPEAQQAYEQAEQRFGSFESKAEFLIWALGQGQAQADTAARLQAEIDKAMSKWNAHTRQLHRELLARVNQARSGR